MSILIYTSSGDVHGKSVEWLAKQRGHDVISLHTEDFPAQCTSSIRIGKRGAELLEWNGMAEFSGWKPDVVWNRRLSAPNLDVDLHSADVRFAARESASYLDAFNSICRADVSK